MAVQTKPFIRMSAHDELVLEVFMEYEDTDFREINDDGDPDDFRVIRWFGTNHTAAPIPLLIKRGNGAVWKDFTIPVGDFSQDAGGPVRYEFDVPQWTYG